MRSERFIVLYPAGLILTISLLLAGLWPDRSESLRFESLIEQITTAAHEDVEALRQAAESYVDFQRKALSPQPGEETARPIADLYFHLGGALLSRPEDDYLKAARDCFTDCLQLYPNLRQGWPHFQLGRLYERLGGRENAEEARSHYERVRLLNSGELSLRAGYRRAWLDGQYQIEPVSTRAVYDFLRFASGDVWGDLRPFAQTDFEEGEESLYLQAMQAQARGDAPEANRLWERYRTLRPSDYSAAYYRDRASGLLMKPSYPEDGNLLASCYAPRAFRDGEFLLVRNHSIRADFYLPPAPSPGSQPGSWRISVEWENPFHKRLTLFVTLNQQTRPLVDTGESESRADLLFGTLPERNLVNLHVLFEDGEPVTDDPLWVRVRSLSLHPAEPEPNS